MGIAVKADKPNETGPGSCDKDSHLWAGLLLKSVMAMTEA